MQHFPPRLRNDAILAQVVQEEEDGKREVKAGRGGLGEPRAARGDGDKHQCSRLRTAR